MAEWDTSGRELTCLGHQWPRAHFPGNGGAMAHSSDRVPGALLCHNITPRRNQIPDFETKKHLKNVYVGLYVAPWENWDT